MRHKLWPILFLIPIALTIGASIFLKTAVGKADCRLLDISVRAENTEKTQFSFSSNLMENQYLFVGNLANTHKVISPTGITLDPVVSSRARTSDTWPHYYVYKILSTGNHVVNISRAKPIAKPPLSGMQPRVCSGYDSTKLPLIVPSTTSMSNMLALGTTAFLLLIIALVGGFGRRKLPYLAHFSFFGVVVLASLKANHNYDSMIFQGAMGQVALFTVVGLLTSYPIFTLLRARVNSNRLISIITVHIIIGALVAPRVEFTFFGQSVYQVYNAAIILICGFAYVFKKEYAAALALLIFPLDTGPSFGFQPYDFPIISTWFVSAVAFYSIDLWKIGAGAALNLLGRQIFRIHQYEAYRELRRLVESQITSLLATDYDSVLKFLNLCTEAFACKYVTLALKDGNEFKIFRFNAVTKTISRHNQTDGIGVVLNRVLVFDDAYELHQISKLNLTKDNRFKKKTEYAEFDFFSCIAIHSHQDVIGALSITGYRDEDLFENGLYISETAGQIQSLVNFLSSKATSETLRLSNDQRTTLKEMKDQLFLLTKASTSADKLYSDFFDFLFNKYGLESILFKRKGNEGVPALSRVADCPARQAISTTNLKIGPDLSNQSGPTIVALTEGKTSFISGAREMQQVLHPKTVEMLQAGKITAFGTYALQSTVGNHAWVVLISENLPLFFRNNLHSVLTDLIDTIQSMLSFVEYQGSNRTLNLLTSRLVSDNELRDLVIAQSTQGQLPATIGFEETGYVINVDLISSKSMSEDSANRAELLGRFFDYSILEIRSIFSGVSVCKSTGDGVILRVSAKSLQEPPSIQEVISIFSKINEFAVSLGSDGIRTCIHYGSYFVGVVGTKHFGQVDAIGHNVDRIFRMEQEIKKIPDLLNRPVISFSYECVEVLKGESAHWEHHHWSKKAGSMFIQSIGKKNSRTQTRAA